MNIEEEFHNIWRQIGSGASKVAGDSTQMSWRQSKLKAFTDYRVTVAACNNLLLDQHSQHLACGPNVLRSFRTDVGRPGKPNEPVVTFKNSSIVELKWDKEFQVSWVILWKLRLYCEPSFSWGRLSLSVGTS